MSRGVFVLLLIAALVATCAMPQPQRLSGVRSLREGVVSLPTLNITGRVAALVAGTMGFGAANSYAGQYSQGIPSIDDMRAVFNSTP